MTLCLCGDVMLGRGVDQILAHPGDPRITEVCIEDARDYVTLAEHASGPIPRPVDDRWPWGDALAALADADTSALADTGVGVLADTDTLADHERAGREWGHVALAAHAPGRRGAAVRVMNLETSVTRVDDFAPDKAVHYRMSPDNLGCLAAGRPDVCSLANNHVLDFGRRGLVDTLEALSAAGIAFAGAGRDAEEAWRPVTVPAGSRGRGRVLVLACAAPTSGVPPDWAATATRPGVALLAPPWQADADTQADAILSRVAAARRPGDVVVVSIHWGSNWGYDVDDDQIRLAHGLVDGGVDVVHGHSSHHPRPVEIYRDSLVLYGCGDFIDDYEGITGHESYRDDLRPLYTVVVDASTGTLLDARLTLLRTRRLRLERAATGDAIWLAETLDRVSRPHATRVIRAPSGDLTLCPA
nr:CapA family protein [Frankia nepalensis]